MIRPAILAAILGALPIAGFAQGNSGAYLAGRAAQQADDFAPSSRYLSEALRGDPDDAAMREALIGARISLLEVESAADLGREIEGTGTSQVARLAVDAVNVAEGNWQNILDDQDSGETVAPLWDELTRAWAQIGLGDTEAALSDFDAVMEEQGVGAYGLYHKALALASLERYDEAADLLASAEDLQLTRRGLAAEAQILAQAGRPEDAIAALREGTGNNLDPVLEDLVARIEAGETPDYNIAPDARAGVAELAFDIGNLVTGDAAPSYALLYARISQYLRPDHVEAALLSAVLLEEMGQHDLASAAYGTVPESSPAYGQARLGRAEVQLSMGEEAAAIDTMRALADEDPTSAVTLITLGDTLRDARRYEEAREAYTRAIDLFEGDQAQQWVVYFARAITSERLGDWDRAASDFDKALELNPGQPAVLNYYGYTLVERRERLDEALGMIEDAVEAQPESGAITDSLAWAYYRLGRYQEAVAPMERAVELMPTDPVLNDHLGDVLWAVGRRLEARFQWQRALSFVTDETTDIDPDRIRRKIEIGLDEVLSEEGAPPIEISRANEG